MKALILLSLMPLALTCAIAAAISLIDTLVLAYGNDDRFSDSLILFFISFPLAFMKCYIFKLMHCSIQLDPAKLGLPLVFVINFLTDLVALFVVFLPFVITYLLGLLLACKFR